MMDWKSQLRVVFQGLLHTHANAPLSEIERILRGVLGLDELSFLDSAGRQLPGSTPLREALDRAGRAIARVHLPPPLAGPPGAEELRPAAAAESRFREGPAPLELGPISADPRFEPFVREFGRLSRRHGFMWAGYVVRELLPRLGFRADESKHVLDKLRQESILLMSKVQNPKNPEFPATGVQLNREHPRVREVLGDEPAMAREEPAEPEEPS